MHLPDLDGPDALVALRALPGCAATPAIAISGLDEDEARHVVTKDFAEYLLKPVDLDVLQATVQRHLNDGVARMALIFTAFWYELVSYAHRTTIDALATYAAFAALALLFGARRPRAIAAAGALAGLTVVLRFQLLPMAGVMALLALWRWRRSAWPWAIGLVTVIADGAAGLLMRSGEIDAVIVGADRVAANGDVANKIGTYMIAVLAERHRIPFYVACPIATIDPGIADGAGIPIEERDGSEVAGFGSTQWTPDNVGLRNPAFDITPAALVTALITERGLASPPDRESIARLLRQGT